MRAHLPPRCVVVYLFIIGIDRNEKTSVSVQLKTKVLLDVMAWDPVGRCACACACARVGVGGRHMYATHIFFFHPALQGTA